MPAIPQGWKRQALISANLVRRARSNVQTSPCKWGQDAWATVWCKPVEPMETVAVGQTAALLHQAGCFPVGKKQFSRGAGKSRFCLVWTFLLGVGFSAGRTGIGSPCQNMSYNRGRIWTVSAVLSSFMKMKYFKIVLQNQRHFNSLMYKMNLA